MKSVWLFLGLIIKISLLAGANITVVTFLENSEYRQAIEVGLKTSRQYCQQHDYEFLYYEEPGQFSRLLDIMSHSSSDWIFWLDSNSLITNLAIPLEDFIDDQHNFVVTSDFNIFNFNQVLIRNSEQTREVLRDLVGFSEGIEESINNKNIRKMTRIVPQRLMNSSPVEVSGFHLNTSYQTGDFIVHFPNGLDAKTLQKMFDVYANRIINDTNPITLDSYLGIYNFKLSPLHSANNEGYMSDAQKKQFAERLRKLPKVKKVAELGLNGGHWMTNLFQNCVNLQHVVSFDINHHRYTAVAVEYFTRFQKNRFSFIEGDSLLSIPKYSSENPNMKFDLIYVDGNHTYSYCLQDIINFRAMATSDTVLWIDDYFVGMGVKPAVDQCVKDGIIQIDKVHHSHDPIGERCWVEAHYLD